MRSSDVKREESPVALTPTGGARAAESVRRNLIASIAGQMWFAIVQVASIPIYARLLGIEAYGLIGFFVFLQTALQVFDLGLSPTMSRELARITRLGNKPTEARNFVRTIETVYWGIALVLGVMFVAFGPTLASRWLKPTTLPLATVERTLRIMGLVAALQWPLTLYQSGLNGLHRQRLMNVVRSGAATFGAVGAIALLVLVDRSIVTFFLWQVAVAVLQVLATRVALWRSLPGHHDRPKFDAQWLRGIKRFATGMTAITISAITLTQLDKLVLSRVLSLADFGYYTLASVLSNGVLIAVTPLFNIYFPVFSTLASADDQPGLRRAYHTATQLMAVLVCPLGLTLSLLSEPAIFVWTGDAETARHAGPILRLLVLGSMLNGLMTIPYALQIAHGWTRIGLVLNSVLILLLIPAMITFTSLAGAVGGASVWLSLNVVLFALSLPLTHRRLLRGAASTWLFRDVAMPLTSASIAPAIVALALAGQSIGRWSMIVLLGTTGMASVSAAVLAAPILRRMALSYAVRVLQFTVKPSAASE